MEVILHKDVPGIGKAGAVAKVKDGFALNYLIPKGLALPSTEANLKKLAQEKERQSVQQQKLKHEAELLRDTLNGLSLTIPVLVHDQEKLYANIVAQDIARVLKEEGHEVDKSHILLEEPIKALGIYEIPVRLHPEVTAKIKMWIVKK